MSYTFGYFRLLQLFIHISCIPQDADTPCSWALDRKGCQTCFDAHGGDCHWSHWGSWCWGLGVHMGSGSPDGLAESLARSQWNLGWLKVSFPSFQRLKAVEIVQSFFWLYKYFVLQWYGSSAPVQMLRGKTGFKITSLFCLHSGLVLFPGLIFDSSVFCWMLLLFSIYPKPCCTDLGGEGRRRGLLTLAWGREIPQGGCCFGSL